MTRQADSLILNGVTRTGLRHVMAMLQLRLDERPFSVAEAKTAREAFLTSASNFIIPVVRIDDTVVGDGGGGPLTRRLIEAYAAYAAAGGQDRA